MDKETLKYVLAQSTTHPLPTASPRTIELPLNSPKVLALIGIRRSGKTYLLYETMRRMKAQGVDRRQMLYLNFEDDRLLHYSTGFFKPAGRIHGLKSPTLFLQPERPHALLMT